MREITLDQARRLAGIDHGDPEFLQDVKFLGWWGDSKYRIVDSQNLGTQRQQAGDLGIEVLIIKD